MVHIFSIEGSIGSGKSTLIRELQTKLKTNWVFVMEPVSEWNDVTDNAGENILTKFYKDQKKYAFSFQMMAYISRLARLKQVVRDNPNAVIITERSIFADRHVFAKMLYDNNKIEEVDYIIYLKWFDAFLEEVQLSGIIYLEAKPETCYDRVQKRNREGETISLEYLKSCHQYHENWLTTEKNVLPLNGENNFENNIPAIGAFYRQIAKFIKNRPKNFTPTNQENFEWKEILHC